MFSFFKKKAKKTAKNARDKATNDAWVKTISEMDPLEMEQEIVFQIHELNEKERST